jgi:NO-binding membrane sensor protein with MHYT domain
MRHDLALIVVIVVQSICFVLCTRTNRAYSAVVGGIVLGSSSHACCSGGHDDLTPVIPGLSG